MNVLKFGGSSLAKAERVSNVAEIVASKLSEGPLVLVLSAFGGVTDALLQAANQAALKDSGYTGILKDLEERHLEVLQALIPVQKQSALISQLKRQLNQLETLLEGCFLLGELSPRSSDLILAHGELLSSFIVSEVLKTRLEKVLWKDARDLIWTNDQFGKATVIPQSTVRNIKRFYQDHPDTAVLVVPGFVSSTPDGQTTTLGRGGSDYTAAIFAHALDAEKLEIWTDVSGMFTANPQLVKQAHPIPHLSYEEAMELSHFGAKVLYPPTIQPVLEKKIPIWIKNTFQAQDEGTLVTEQTNGQGKLIKGISHVENIALLTVTGTAMIGIPGFSKRLFEVLSRENINVTMITQASSEHSICIGIAEKEADAARLFLEDEFQLEISRGRISGVEVEKELAIVAIVGDNMRNHQGVSGRMFRTLGQNNVNIRAIAQGASERNISTVIAKKDVKKALNSLHERFFEEDIKQLNLFIVGAGNVGAKLLEQLQKQKKFLKEHLKLNIRVVGLSNSRQMIFDTEGISLKNWQEKLSSGETASLERFYHKTLEINKRNSVFVDNTASDVVAGWYDKYLSKSIAVVTCNKIACSSDYQQYQNLKSLSKRFNAAFLYETNVGAGLPIIDTLKNLVASGDRVRKIQAVLSGSLNFVFNNFSEANSFHDVVMEAKRQGYTEPDPKIDLSGVDVMRKILILARESGLELDIDSIANRSFLPQECLDTTSVASFFDTLKKHESHFQGILAAAKEKACRLKYVAQLVDGQASVGLQEIPSDHPFYNLEGKDNIVLFFTDRYSEQPLLVKGAGAGADVTASGIFADIIRIGNI